MRVLLLSAYDTASHRYWRESLVKQFPECDWTVLTLAPRYFNFRVRTNPLSWLSSHRKELASGYDLLIATSLVDIVTLRGLVPALAQTPAWIYCHENQFAYPASEIQSQRQSLQHNLDVKMVFLYTLLSADAISFNSDWNRRSAFEGLRQLFRQFPEQFDEQLIFDLKNRSTVLPVPLMVLDASEEKLPQSADKPLQLVWNHRWEYDKGPEYLLAFVEQLLAVDLMRPVVLHIVGQQFRQQPAEFSVIQRLLSEPPQRGRGGEGAVELGAFGFIDSEQEYHELLIQCDVVISTALHDFQGLAVMQAVQRGCVPLVPNALAYPEQYPEEYRYTWYLNPVTCAQSMIDKLKNLPGVSEQKTMLTLADFSWKALRPMYQKQLHALV